MFLVLSFHQTNLQEKLEVTNEEIRSRKSKDRFYNVQKDKRTNNDIRNIAPKTKDIVTRTPLKIGDELRYVVRVNSSCSTSDTRRVIVNITIK